MWKTCLYCNNPFKVQHRNVFVRSKYCSMECRYKYRREYIPQEEQPRWKGGRYIHKSSGYVYIRMNDHPQRQANGYVAEHRLVMEMKSGRLLHADEDVHHINGIRDDNRASNLNLLTKAKHQNIHRIKFKPINCKRCNNLFKPRKKTNVFCSRKCYVSPQ